MGHFQTATALTRRGSGTVFDAELDPQWTIGAKLHGGYLLALPPRPGSLLRNGSGENPEMVLRLARAAMDAFIIGNVGEKAVEAVEQIRIAYERAGSLEELDEFVETEAAPAREHLIAQLDHVAAHVLSAAGRAQEAARRALRAAEAFHRIGEPDSARDVDLLLEQILFGDND